MIPAVALASLISLLACAGLGFRAWRQLMDRCSALGADLD
jgi:hypothetical protein